MTKYSQHRETPLIGRQRERAVLERALLAATKGKGSIVCINAESGYGKTQLCVDWLDSIGTKAEFAMVECSAPIGHVQIGSIQPLLPFAKALEELMEKGSSTAKKKLAVNIGLTVLGLIPIAGAVFDATKEVMRDVREYKRDTKQPAKEQAKNPVQEMYNAFVTYSEHAPLVLVVDDAQWMDAQSVELLELFAQQCASLPIVLVVLVQKSTVLAKNAALAAWMEDYQSNENCLTVELSAFTHEEIVQLCLQAFPKMQSASELAQWLLQRTTGIPSIAHEYVQYFLRHSPFKPSGELDIQFLSSGVVPASLQATFAKNIEQLSEEDRNLLALCSAEGREFTAYMVAELLHTDVVATIKRLKSLQVRTGVVRSLGAHARYGTRTTVYEFTQAMHHQYFHSTLEYEERVELHERISSTLQGIAETTSSEELQHQLAPYIAAHSIEAGNEEVARKMLLDSAHQAEDIGSEEIVSEAMRLFNELKSSDVAEEKKELERIMQRMQGNGETENDSNTDSALSQPGIESAHTDAPDVQVVRNDAMQFYFNGEFTQSEERIESFLQSSGSFITAIDYALLCAMASRACTENNRLAKAQEYIYTASEKLAQSPDDYAQAFILNAKAVLEFRLGNTQSAWELLQTSASLSTTLSEDVKLLTLTNAALLMKHNHTPQARSFEKTARALARSLHLSDFSEYTFE